MALRCSLGAEAAAPLPVLATDRIHAGAGRFEKVIRAVAVAAAARLLDKSRFAGTPEELGLLAEGRGAAGPLALLTAVRGRAYPARRTEARTETAELVEGARAGPLLRQAAFTGTEILFEGATGPFTCIATVGDLDTHAVGKDVNSEG